MSLKPPLGSSSKGFSYDELPRLDPNPIEKSRYQMYGDPKPDGTYQIQKTLWDGTNIQVTQRVGDEERMWVRDKLTRLHVAGFLTPAEYQARDSAAEAAITRPDLNRLISDLPAHEDDWKGARKIPLGTYPVTSRQEADKTLAVMKKKRPDVLALASRLAAVLVSMTGIIVATSSSPSLTVIGGIALMLLGIGTVLLIPDGT